MFPLTCIYGVTIPTTMGTNFSIVVESRIFIFLVRETHFF